MNHPPIVMLAKFVPNLQRMEPINVGVIVWDNGNVRHKFLGESPSGITPPSIVPDDGRHAYREWVRYCQLQLAKKEIRRRDGSKVERDSPEFLSTLSSKSKPRFMIVECAKLAENLNGNMSAAVEEFFESLVQPVGSKKTKKSKQLAQELKTSCKTVLEDADVVKPNYYRSNRHLPAKQKEAWQEYVFDYSLGNGHLDALLHRVLLDKPVNVASAGWNFQWVQNSSTVEITEEQCAVLFNSKLHDMGNREVDGAITALSPVCKVIDVSNHDLAVFEVAKMALSL